MIALPDDEDFEFSQECWVQIVADAGLPPDNWQMRYDLQRLISDWLREPSPTQMRHSMMNNDRVASSALALLEAIEETGADFHLEDGQTLGGVVSGVVSGWDYWRWEIKRHGDDAGRPPLRYKLCWLWRNQWRRELAASVDPATGAAGGPLVRFLIAVHELVTEERLTPHQARYAIRKMQREIPDPPSADELAAEQEAGRRTLDYLTANGEHKS